VFVPSVSEISARSRLYLERIRHSLVPFPLAIVIVLTTDGRPPPLMAWCKALVASTRLPVCLCAIVLEYAPRPVPLPGHRLRDLLCRSLGIPPQTPATRASSWHPLHASHIPIEAVTLCDAWLGFGSRSGPLCIAAVYYAEYVDVRSKYLPRDTPLSMPSAV